MEAILDELRSADLVIEEVDDLEEPQQLELLVIIFGVVGELLLVAGGENVEAPREPLDVVEVELHECALQLEDLRELVHFLDVTSHTAYISVSKLHRLLHLPNVLLFVLGERYGAVNKGGMWLFAHLGQLVLTLLLELDFAEFQLRNDK